MAEPALLATERRSILLAQAQHEVPRVLFGSRIVILLFDLAILIAGTTLPQSYFISDLVQLVVIFSASLIYFKSTPAKYVPWLFAAAVITNNVVMNFQYVIDPTGNAVGVILILLSVTGALILDWRAFFVVVIITMSVTSWTLLHYMEKGAEGWITAALTAAGMSALLLWGRVQTASKLADAALQAAELATTDPLTGLFNRRGIEQTELAFHRRALREQQFIFVMFCDIEGLKHVNDHDGHAAGDQLLNAVARALTQAVRPDDLVARWGGDEFIVVGIGQAPDSKAFKARLDAALVSQPLPRSWHGAVTTGTSMGFNQPLPELIEQADAAMYKQRHRS